MHFASIQIRFEHWLPVWFGGSQCRRKGKERFWQGSAKVFWPQILNFKLNIVSSARCEAYSHGWASTFCCQQFDFFRDPTSGGLYQCQPDENCKRNLKTNSFPGHCGGAWCDPHKARAKPQRAISSELPIARYDQQVRLPIFMISSWELIIYLWGCALLSSRTQLWKSAAPLWMRRIRRCRTVHFWCWKSHLISSNIRVKNYIMDRSGMGIKSLRVLSYLQQPWTPFET